MATGNEAKWVGVVCVCACLPPLFSLSGYSYFQPTRTSAALEGAVKHNPPKQQRTEGCMSKARPLHDERALLSAPADGKVAGLWSGRHCREDSPGNNEHISSETGKMVK